MKNIWLIGAGKMAIHYVEVLKNLGSDFIIIGRGEESALNCQEETGCEVYRGGLNKFLHVYKETAEYAIVAVEIQYLSELTRLLISRGVSKILIEKPGGITKKELNKLLLLSQKNNVEIYIAYNRRFYASTLRAKEIIAQDEGVTSFNFEFTEWSSNINIKGRDKDVLSTWFLANSTHVVDLAFFLGGEPKEICTFTKGSISWHESSSVFSGAGVSIKGALFSYQANWESAGRWSVEILTNAHRLIFRPMEKLQIQKRGTIVQEYDSSIDYALDEKFKPGLYLQTKYFLNNNTEEMCSIEEQSKMMTVYNKIANYKD